MSYRIVTDATADISEDLIRDVPEITIVPMEITLDGELMRIERSDGPDVSAFYEKIRNGADAKTSQINIEVYREVFSKLLDEGLDVLYLCFTSGLSGTINAAHIAIDELSDDYPGRKIVCVDTLAAAIGEGFLVREAARMQGEGLSMSELIDWVEKNKLLVCHKFAVDSMTHLLKGGRMLSSVANIGNALQIKPMLRVDEEGKLKLSGNAHGKTQAMKKLSHMPDGAWKPEISRLFVVGHADCPEDAERLKEMVLASYPEADIRISQIGPVIGCHTGPGMAALVYWGNNR